MTGRGPIYIAALSSDDYPRFRERDPTLPLTYPQYLAGLEAHVRTWRGRSVVVEPYPIGFDDFAERNDILGIASFDAATRNDYAAEQAHAQASASRL